MKQLRLKTRCCPCWFPVFSLYLVRGEQHWLLRQPSGSRNSQPNRPNAAGTQFCRSSAPVTTDRELRTRVWDSSTGCRHLKGYRTNRVPLSARRNLALNRVLANSFTDAYWSHLLVGGQTSSRMFQCTSYRSTDPVHLASPGPQRGNLSESIFGTRNSDIDSFQADLKHFSSAYPMDYD